MQNDSVKFKNEFKNRLYAWVLRLIKFIDALPKGSVSDVMGKQLLRSGTSVLVNYIEANSASSKKDFINKLCISKKETKETKYWLELIVHALPSFKEEARILWKEAQELNLILATIIRKCKDN